MMTSSIIEFFSNPNKVTAYLLGYLWADGYLGDFGYRKTVSLTIVEDDGKFILPLFLMTGKWCTYLNLRRTSSPNSRPQLQIYKQDIKLHNFLKNLGYKTKSGKDPKLVLELINASLHHYFWRGYIDGDGCFYVRKNGKSPQFSISSCYEQDWFSCENLCKKLGISYKIRRRVLKLGKGSSFEIVKRKDIKKLGDYLYSDYDNIIGLNRKYQKYLKIKTYDVKPGRKLKTN